MVGVQVLPSDRDTPIFELKRQILAMCRRKGWGDENGVQDPQHVAMAMTVEMAELLEHFQWLNAADVERLLQRRRPGARGAHRRGIRGRDDVRPATGRRFADRCDAADPAQDRHRGPPERRSPVSRSAERRLSRPQGGTWIPILFSFSISADSRRSAWRANCAASAISARSCPARRQPLSWPRAAPRGLCWPAARATPAPRTRGAWTRTCSPSACRSWPWATGRGKWR